MRVLAIGSMYPPHHLGGYELVWRSAVRHLRERGHRVRVLTSDLRIATPASEEHEEPEIFRELRWYWRDHAFPRLGWRERIELERHNARVLAAHLAELNPDVVSWWAMGGMSLSLLERVRRAGVPAVAFVADDWLLYGPLVDQWTRPFRRSALLAAVAERLTGLPARVRLDDVARYVLASETLRRSARGAGLALAGSQVSHLGVDDSFLKSASPHPWRWRLLYVGRIDARKGVIDAVEALARLDAGATLTIAGEGDPAERARLDGRVAALALGRRVSFTGMLSRPQLSELYEAADAVLFPVRWSEPWGLVPLEAMARGRPVVATGLGGSGEYLRDRRNCLLVPPADPAALAAAVAELGTSDGLRERLRAEGVRTAAAHTESAFNSAVESALQRACASSARRSASDSRSA
jgi:glycogen(starch) synthase